MSPTKPAIIMTPPLFEPGNQSRRPPAHRSVSLLHSPRKRVKRDIDCSNSDESGARPTPTLPYDFRSQVAKKNSSEECSNADTWFEKSNNDARHNSVPFVDNDPPFFMRNSSSSDTPPEAQQQQANVLDSAAVLNSLNLPPGLMHINTAGGGTDDYRAVIDDLTIENKKLRRRLRKYKTLHDSHLKDEKLFEVRIHGLLPEKKRELEETLRRFTAGLTNSPADPFVNGYDGVLPRKVKTEASRNTDSAYASATSGSGQGSSRRSDVLQNIPRTIAPQRQQNIQSYLHDIPEGLLPRKNPVHMSERAKKKLVVRRLEQIFAGKGAAGDGHQQPLQQQEVSQSAARADRSKLEASGQRAHQEGNRESFIMDEDYDEGPADRRDAPDLSNSSQRAGKVQQQDFDDPLSIPSALEQRPTRPLDLDPYRAQVPADNIHYMRHLGFSPPDSGRAADNDHGWVYLNLLVNMAQLHTVNVTTEFVLKAVDDYSKNFEISPDGRKLRWRGSQGTTKLSSSGNGTPTGSIPDDQSPRKRPKLMHRVSGHSDQTGAGQQSHYENSRFSYTPLFRHRDSTDDGDDSSCEAGDDGMSSPYVTHLVGESSGMTSTGIRAMTPQKRKARNDGPIIFYNNAQFCKDLSGDRWPPGAFGVPPYTTFGTLPLGKPRAAGGLENSETRGPLYDAHSLPEPMNLCDNPIPQAMELTFPPPSTADSGSEKANMPVDMEVTGMGGIWPADNFAINVRSQHFARNDDSSPVTQKHTKFNSLPPRLMQVLQSHSIAHTSNGSRQGRVLSAHCSNLQPSQLPPAMGYMSFGDSSPDDDNTSDVEVSTTPLTGCGKPSATAPQVVDMFLDDSEGEHEAGDDDDDDNDNDKAESDDSLDLLAAARELDPDAIRQYEREYDANMAERLQEEIPAGSSAATAGGGSGYMSPTEGDVMIASLEPQHATRTTRLLARPLRRAVSSDSMAVQGPVDSSEEDGEVSDTGS